LASAQKELRTDLARHIQDPLSGEITRLKQQIAAILFKRAPEQHDSIKLKPCFALH